jgi:EAL domain-containing protein (putative c-di-GMP-specific phosphodiesterase class I)
MTSSSDPDEIFEHLELLPQYAPIRRLQDDEFVATELQIRGRHGTALDTPKSLRRAARMMQQTGVVDRRKLSLLTESPVGTGFPVLATVDLASAARPGFATPEGHRLFVSVDPGDAFRRPHAVLGEIAAAREAGQLICVDSLGLDDRALTLLWLLEPDVIVIPAQLLERSDDPDVAQLAHALTAHVERTGALVIAEGVDTESRRVAAQTVGATHGMGKLFPSASSPSAFADQTVAPFPHTAPPSARDRGPDDNSTTTPYAIVSTDRAPRRGDKRLLIEMSKALESQAAAAGPGTLVLGTFQQARHFTPATARRWRALADHAGFAGVYGVGLSQILDGKIQHAPLDPADDLVDEWTVVVLGPHAAALLSARDRGETAPDLERTFDVVQSYDRDLTTRAAHAILARFTIPANG